MDNYRQMYDLLKGIKPSKITIAQGIIKAVDGLTCSVEIGGITVSDVRLRASESNNPNQILVIPKIGSAVLMCSLSGDLQQLAIIQIDEIEKIEINGGKLGGLINIEELTTKLNNIEKDINNLKSVIQNWIPVAEDGGASLKTAASSWAARQIELSSKSDYEDENIKH